MPQRRVTELDKKIVIMIITLAAGICIAAVLLCSTGYSEHNDLDTSRFDADSFSITGDGDDFYSVQKNSAGEYTVTISDVPNGGTVSVEGKLLGNIIIDVDDSKEIELEFHDASIVSRWNSPIKVVSADAVTISVKKGYSCQIYDLRSSVDEDAGTKAAIYSEVDLDIEGKGVLTVTSYNNNGIHTKKDLSVKNLTMTVQCCDNALKGKKTVEIQSGDVTLIATKGDGIKTVDSDTKYNDDGTVKKQNGTVTISSEKGDLTLNIYAACDGIDAAYDVIVSESEEYKLVLNIQTDEYSDYSEEVTVKEDEQDEEDQKEEFDPLEGGFDPSSMGKPDKDPQAREQEGFDPSDMPEDMPGQSRPGTDTPWNGFDPITMEPGDFDPSQMNIPEGWQGGGGFQPGTDPSIFEQKAGKSYSTKGIKAANSIMIYGGTINIQSLDDCIHANNDKEVDTDLSENGYGNGYVEISGGNITLKTDDDAIHADQDAIVLGGTIVIGSCYEGIEGQNVKIAGGQVSIHAFDDGINSTAKTAESITVSGGYLYVVAGGDAIDSNSTVKNDNILFSGGEAVLFSNSSFDTSIDTDSGYKYTGGNVVSICLAGGFSSDTYNCSNFSEVGTKQSTSVTEGDYLEVSDISGLRVTVKIPETIRSCVLVYLGSNHASFETTKSTTADLNEDGVHWEDRS